MSVFVSLVSEDCCWAILLMSTRTLLSTALTYYRMVPMSCWMRRLPDMLSGGLLGVSMTY